MANLQFTIPQSSISLAHLDRGRRLHAHTYMLRAVAEDLFRPANHVRSIYWQPIVLYDAADWNHAVGLNQVGKLPGEILLHGDDRRGDVKGLVCPVPTQITLAHQSAAADGHSVLLEDRLGHHLAAFREIEVCEEEHRALIFVREIVGVDHQRVAFFLRRRRQHDPWDLPVPAVGDQEKVALLALGRHAGGRPRALGVHNHHWYLRHARHPELFDFEGQARAGGSYHRAHAGDRRADRSANRLALG